MPFPRERACARGGVAATAALYAHHGRPNGEVGHKHAVKDVDVNPLGAGVDHAAHVALKVGEVG